MCKRLFSPGCNLGEKAEHASPIFQNLNASAGATQKFSGNITADDDASTSPNIKQLQRTSSLTFIPILLGTKFKKYLLFLKSHFVIFILVGICVFLKLNLEENEISSREFKVRTSRQRGLRRSALCCELAASSEPHPAPRSSGKSDGNRKLRNCNLFCVYVCVRNAYFPKSTQLYF